jgi:hypothetical protein
MDATAPLTLPHPDELRQRIASCERELRQLKLLLRTSVRLHAAEESRREREAGDADAR